MHIGFALFRYFPFGGLQRDMLAIAHECARRDQRITIFARSWEGPQPDWADVRLLAVKGLSNHVRNRRFADALGEYLQRYPVDVLAGFDKMPGLDIYYAADSCFAEKIANSRMPGYGRTPRNRTFMAMEAGVFGAESPTRVMYISGPERDVYEKHYPGAHTRGELLPPGIRRDRIMPEDYEDQRNAMRSELGASADDKLLLFVGSGFRTKGLDRAIEALAVLRQGMPGAQLIVVGDDKAAPYRRLAKRLGVATAVRFMGGRDDVPRFLWAADVLVHPARRENTGTVLLEALVAGLPVVCSEACGYAGWVRDSGLGSVTGEAVPANVLATELQLLADIDRESHRQAAQAFADSADIYDLVRHAADLVCDVVGAA